MPVSVDVTAAAIAGNYSTSLNKSYINIPVNASFSLKSVSGYVKDDGGAVGFGNLTIVPYLLESGNMVFSEGTLPLNMSQFMGGTDIFDASTGFYNISLPGTATASNILLVAYSDKSGVYYAGFNNISLGWGASPVVQFNITAKPLAGSLVNFTVTGPTTKTIWTYKKRISILNGSGDAITSASTHVEAKLAYNLTFTWMLDSGRNGYVCFRAAGSS
jgi:hypothetical protein